MANWHKENAEHLRRYRARYSRTIDRRYVVMQRLARNRELPCTVTLSEFRELLQKACAYCGFDLNETGCGLDRMDNALGYVIENVAPCCHVCNQAKSDFFSADEMKTMIGPSIRAVRMGRANEKKNENLF